MGINGLIFKRYTAISLYVTYITSFLLMLFSVTRNGTESLTSDEYVFYS